MSNKNGIKVQIINHGVTITSIKVPIANDNFTDVVLVFDNPQSYIASYKLQGAPYYGEAAGRYPGRIKKGIFILNDITYHWTSGICFETQYFTDAPNQEQLPNSVFKKSPAHHQKTVYKFENIY